MADTDFFNSDDFDDGFFEIVDKLTATASTQPPKPYNHPPQPQPQPQPQSLISDAAIDVSYSPPRELSQRFRPPPDTNAATSTITASSTITAASNRSIRSVQSPASVEQLEIEKLKSELSQVSKQLCDLKQECSELKRERDTKQNKSVSVYSNTEANIWKSGPLVLDNTKSEIALRCENPSASHAASRISIEQKSVGVQTEKGDESVNASTSGATSTYYFPKLLAVWSSGSSHRSRRKFVAKLLETCANDFCFLFGCLGPNVTSKIDGYCSTLVPFHDNLQDLHSAEVARVSHLYTVITKLSNDMVCVDVLLEALVDLCSLENALVVRRSLHILHVALDHLLSTDRTLPRSVLCSGIMSRWRDLTQMLSTFMILNWEKVVACIILLELRHSFQAI